MPKHIVIFSHGFGVRKDSRGMFTDIAEALSPDTEKILFDYGQWDEVTQTLTVPPINERVKKLELVISETRTQNPDAIIDLICHSQGCVAAGLAKPKGIRKIVLLGPPAELSPEEFSKVFTLPGTAIDFDGVSTLARRDGSTTIVPKAYWDSIRGLDPITLYNALADTSKVVAVHANQDEVIGSLDFSRLSPKIKQIRIDANHNFTDDARAELIEAVQPEFERVPVVDEQDNIITHKFRDEVADDDIYRVSALWLKNSKGDILLAQRAFAKHNDPGRWQGAAAGTVEEGETYLENIIKEAHEEIGIENLQVTPGPKMLENGKHRFFAQFFIATLDKPAEAFKIKQDEVLQVRWFSRDELAHELRTNPDKFTPGTAWAFKEL